MRIPTARQYSEVIRKYLSDRQKHILVTLYHFPNSSATSKQLASALGYLHHGGADLQVGLIGKSIAQRIGVVPDLYPGNHGPQPGYFLLVGEYTRAEGWAMRPQLQKALEGLGLVSQ